VVEVEHSKYNCSMNKKKEVIKIVAESKRSISTCSDVKRSKSNCSGFTKKYTMLWQLILCHTAKI
jgi:hypothetical protein